MSVTGPALLLAALLPAAPAEPGPTCRAELDGARLTTTIAFPDGYAVAAPWTVLPATRAGEPGDAGIVLDAALDRVVEEDGITGNRTVTPLRQPVTVTFKGPTRPELVHDAARTWCQTVLRARGTGAPGHGPPLPSAGRLT